MMSGIDLRGVSVSFGQLNLLKEVDLSVPDAEFLTIVGRSGAGKSTLLSLLLGLMRPDSGAVEILGRDISTPWSA